MKRLMFSIFMFTTFFLVGCSKTYDARISWSKPEKGNPPEFYIVEVHIGETVKVSQSSQESINVKLPYNEKCFARVAAVDGLSQQGQFSDYSDTLIVKSPVK